MNYSQAISKPANGYKYMNQEQVLAQLADSLSRKHCLRPSAVFEWAKKHNIPLIDYMARLMNTDNLMAANSYLLQDLLNDKFEAIKQL